MVVIPERVLLTWANGDVREVVKTVLATGGRSRVWVV